MVNLNLKDAERTAPANAIGFDAFIESEIPLPPSAIRSFADLLYHEKAGRSESSEIINSHIDTRFLSVSLVHLRKIVTHLQLRIHSLNLKRGDTVVLVRPEACNELYIALLFLAFAVTGIRVLLPMYNDNHEFPEWVKQFNCRALVVSQQETEALKEHQQEKEQVRKLVGLAQLLGLPTFDTEIDFNLKKLATARNLPNLNGKQPAAYGQADDEILIITTSGSTGNPRLVSYTQRAFLNSCRSWEAANLFAPEVQGGKGLTPLFTHTIGIRQFVNALWTGQATCLINTSWFTGKPENVAFLLGKMKPEHITGGPGVFEVLLELSRNFPELKQTLQASVKQLISIGAPFKTETRNQLRQVFNKPMHNAFGTTETMQILSSLANGNRKLPGPDEKVSLGAPLPGVKIGLQRVSPGLPYFRLWVKAPFMHFRIYGEEAPDDHQTQGFYYTGDMVEYEKGELYYAGRESRDFLNNVFGVKIPLPYIHEKYKQALAGAYHTHLVSLKDIPGLGVILFVNDKQIRPGVVTDRGILQPAGNRLSAVNHELQTSLSPFEFQHYAIRQMAMVNTPPELTAKGSVAIHQLENRYAPLLAAMSHYNRHSRQIRQLPVIAESGQAFNQYLSPCIGRLLQCLGLDYTYHKGKKDSLFYWENDAEVRVLDLTGGYGTNLTGHNHPAIKKVLRQFVQRNGVALSNQSSIQVEAGRLAEMLNREVSRITGRSYLIQLASGGSEAVELAIHHSWFEMKKRFDTLRDVQFQISRGEQPDLFHAVWKANREAFNQARLSVIAVSHAYHGTTPSARALLGDQKLRNRFSPLVALKTHFIDDEHEGWKEQIDQLAATQVLPLKKLVRRADQWVVETENFSLITAAIAEPVQGEGGVRVVNPAVLDYLNRFPFPLIIDEIQSGLGRTGSFVTNTTLSAPYYLFGKALGGSFEKISAVLIAEERFQPRFQLNYLSTFANGELAARVACATLELIATDNLADKARMKGDDLRGRLCRLQSRYPDVIKRVGGKGLMLGIEFADFGRQSPFVLRALFGSDLTGYVFAAYLHKRHHIRVLPSLSAPNTLRIEPSAYITRAEMNQLERALTDLCALLHNRSVFRLLLPLLDDDPFDDGQNRAQREPPITTDLDEPAEGAVKVAFVAHFAYVADELKCLEADLANASQTGLRVLFGKLGPAMNWKPVTIFAKNLSGNRVHFTFYCVPVDAATLEKLHTDCQRKEITEKIQEAAAQAARAGAEVISLGGFTSILTNNALSVVLPAPAKVISGNTLTVASGIRQITDTMKRESLTGPLTLAIVGASGNIGSAVLEYFCHNPGSIAKIVLVGRTESKLRSLCRKYTATGQPGPVLQTSTNLFECRQADVLVLAANSNSPILFPHHIDSGKKVVISDVSVPPAVSPEIGHLQNVTVVPFAACLGLPDDPTLRLSSHTPPGTVFCCAAEAILEGLFKTGLHLRGPIRYDEVMRMMALAEQFGLFDGLEPIKSYKTKS